MQPVLNSPNTTKLPRQIFPSLYSFAPNRETLGGTAYFIVKNTGSVLVDCPPWHKDTETFLHNHGGVSILYLTHRTAISPRVAKIQAALGCKVVIQEQEAYLMPEIDVHSFRESWQFEDLSAIWTPGFSPGSTCLYWRPNGGCLFTGRHLLPNHNGQLLALRTAKTFHWGRQLRSLDKLSEFFETEELRYIFPAANTGFLRGHGFFKGGYNELCAAKALSSTQPDPL